MKSENTAAGATPIAGTSVVELGGGPRPLRLETSSPDLDREELNWWERFAEVEEHYCWVQTPALQRFLRGHYVRRIVAAVPRGGAVLEVGCGTGWLSQLLAEFGASRVVGVDFSAEQIRRARQSSERAGLSGKVAFHLLHGSPAEIAELVHGGAFDAVLIHGVLHHLTKDEIRQLFATLTRAFAPRRARVIVMEPVLHEGEPKRRMLWLMRFLVGLPMCGRRLGLRRRSETEERVRAVIDQRSAARPPRGPSPKEVPFSPGELELLLQPYVEFGAPTPVLLFSFHAARSLLLMGLSHPLRKRLLMWPYLWVVRRVERSLLRRRDFGGQVTVFYLWEGELRSGCCLGAAPS